MTVGEGREISVSNVLTLKVKLGLSATHPKLDHKKPVYVLLQKPTSKKRRTTLNPNSLLRIGDNLSKTIVKENSSASDLLDRAVA